MDFALLFVVGFIGAITPGPDILLVINNTLRHGAFIGIKTLAGIATGWFVFLGIIYFGLGHIFSGVLPQVILSLIGAGYLLYISYLLLKAKESNVVDAKIVESGLDDTRVDPRSVAHPQSKNQYLRGLIVNISNPKAILFFGVIISPYMSSGNILPSLIVLFISLASGFMSVIVLCTFFRRFINDRIFFIIDKACSVIFAVFAISLLFNAFKILKEF